MKRVKAFLAIGLISSMLLAGCQRNGEPLPDSSISVSDKSVYCIIKIYKVAKQKRTMLHVHFGQSCIIAS